MTPTPAPALSLALALALALAMVGPGRPMAQPSAPALTRAESRADFERQFEGLLHIVRDKRIGLITNPTGVDTDLVMVADRLRQSGAATLVSFFAPEHGLRGDRQAGDQISDYVDPVTGLPVHALYGVRRAPTAEQVADLDVLIFDIQDAGARFYTYIWTMTLAMEAAAAAGKGFVVFDRPNPIGGVALEGPPNRSDYGLIGRKWADAPFGLPIRHGMTVGEIAALVNGEWMDPKVDLTVVPMTRWRREWHYDQTGRPWVLPSPNLPTLDTAIVYPGTCLFEGTNLSEGRGTTRPFELFGAPWIDGHALAQRLNALDLPGVRFRPAWFRPTFSKHSGELCGGVQVHVTDWQTFRPVRATLHMMRTLTERYPEDFEIVSGRVTGLFGRPGLAEALARQTPEQLEQTWAEDLEAFGTLRERYLMYE